MEQIINFFNNRNYIIKEDENQLKLLYKDYLILAVDYAETLEKTYQILYCRFCNKDGLFCNPIFVKELISYNQSKYGYNISADEIPFENRYQARPDKATQEYFFNYVQQGNLLDSILDSFVINREFFGIPYQNCFNETVTYFDPRIIQRINQHEGYGFGFTLQEAIINGCYNWLNEVAKILLFMEQCKPMQWHAIYDNDPNLLFVDLSYNFNIPTILGVYFNQFTKNIDFAFATNFDLQKNLAEIKQKLKINHNLTPVAESNTILNSYLQKTLSETNLVNSIIEDTFNTIYSIENEFQQLQQLFEKLHIDLYYRDNSLSNDLYTIHLYSTTIHLACLRSYYYLQLYHNDILYQYYQEYFSYLNLGIKNEFTIYDNKNIQNYDINYNLNLLYADISNPFFGYNNNLLMNLIKKDYSKIAADNYFYSKLHYYLTLKNFLDNNISNEVIDKYFQHFNIQCTDFDLTCDKWTYDEFLQQIYYKPLSNLLKTDYQYFIKTVITHDNEFTTTL